MSVYSIGVSALTTANIGLTTTGHNIANVNTEGYRRQSINQATLFPLQTGSGFLGNGVEVTTVKRSYNQFMEQQVLAADTSLGYLDSYHSSISEIDNMVADSTAGLAPSISQFFQAVNDLATNPASVPARQSVISGANALVTRVQSLNSRLDEMRSGVNTQISTSVQEINGYINAISDLNSRISSTEAVSDRFQANDLRDQRDQAIAELNKLVKVSTKVNDTGGYDVFIGNGQPVVLGPTTYHLAARPSYEDALQTDVFYEVSPGVFSHIKSDLLTGGSLGGVLEFRNTTLNDAQNALGRVTLGLAQEFNDQHIKGMDLNMNAGQAFFDIPQPTVLGSSLNSTGATLNVQNTDIGLLTNSDYRLTYDGTNYTLITQPQNTAQTLTFTGVPPRTQVDGMTIDQPTMAAGDNFLIRPTRNMARDISVAITDPNAVAAAAAIRSSGATGNLGNAVVSQPAINSYNDKVTIKFTTAASYDVINETTGATLASNVAYAPPANVNYNGWTATLTGAPAAGDTFIVDNTYTSTGIQHGTGAISLADPSPGPSYAFNTNLTQPVTITFNGPPNTGTYNVTGTGTGNPTNVAYTSGDWLNYNGWSMQITGTPQPGDTFTINPNDSGVADNRNALELAGLQTKNTLDKNSEGTATSSFSSSYASLVSRVGSKTRELAVSTTAQTTLVNNLKTTQQSLEGVNLDEEAANLIRYQQAYQAAGKLIQTATVMFDTLLGLGA